MSTAAGFASPSPRVRRRRLAWIRFLRRPAAVGSLVVVVFLVAMCAFAPYIAPERPGATDFDAVLAHPSWSHLFGTDQLGRDVFSRVVWGARASIQVGLFATMLALLVAVPLGLLAGYYGGWLDSVIARTTDVLLAFPFLILAIGLAAIIGPSLGTVTIALGVAAIPVMLRVARGEAFALREAEFVPAAVASGATDASIIFRHILPNMSGPLIVVATLTIPRAIIGEATLSYLGLGIQRPGSSWGVMLADAQAYYYSTPRLAVVPGLAIVLAALAFNVLGDGLRDVLDPRTAH
jgi:peptide/nickel transport system permease protein